MKGTAHYPRETLAAWGRLGHAAKSPETLYDPGPLLRQLPGCSARAIAGRLGTSRRQVFRMRAGVPLRTGTADRFATALDLHPSAIW